MNREELEQTVRLVLNVMNQRNECQQNAAPIPVEGSARHVHLSKEHCKLLFGKETLDVKREISQPGQYLSEQRVRIIGPKGVMDNVAVLGPTRSATQVELSLTDGRALGLNLPINQSGDLTGAADLFIQAGDKMIFAPQCAIAALRHIHMPAKDAATYGVHDNQVVSCKVTGARPLTLDGVVIRVSDQFALAMHIDIDEFNAAGCNGKSVCTICGNSAPCPAPVAAAMPAAKAAPAPSAPASMTLEGKLITEKDAREVCDKGAKELLVRKDQLVTPLAKDWLHQHGVTLKVEGRA